MMNLFPCNITIRKGLSLIFRLFSNNVLNMIILLILLIFIN